MRASEAKLIADELNSKFISTELDEIITQITKRAEDGFYSLTYSKIRPVVIDKLLGLGYDVGPYGMDKHIIKWDLPDNESVGEVIVYNIPFDNKDASFMGNITKDEVMFIHMLSEEFPNTVGFIKDMPEVWVSGTNKRPYDVVVYEKGIRGPADWMFLNEDGRWAHGGYTGYKDTYDNQQFVNLIRKIHTHNGNKTR
jgi:hypothetical protein